MEHSDSLDVLAERSHRADKRLDALTDACQNLAITAGKHDEQIAILTKIFYGGAAIFVAQVVTLVVKAAK